MAMRRRGLEENEERGEDKEMDIEEKEGGGGGAASRFLRRLTLENEPGGQENETLQLHARRRIRRNT